MSQQVHLQARAHAQAVQLCQLQPVEVNMAEACKELVLLQLSRRHFVALLASCLKQQL